MLVKWRVSLPLLLRGTAVGEAARVSAAIAKRHRCHVRREGRRDHELHAVQNEIRECCCWDKQLKSPHRIVTNPSLLRTTKPAQISSRGTCC
ncbi:hypothetical protein DPMN_189390 [Dreissena polymorpha]|uniref:Secreted protein n=1 Tax=Dreissena polymorpha TaxID=45954 RepID=A0A9D4DSF3_DREPO|nr:hypothetical protein DPMN_189390 [Dreissena polymorpha]